MKYGADDWETDELEADTQEEYVLNTNTKKFHLKSCQSVAQIKEENKQYGTDRDEILREGYTPCKQCDP